MKPWKTLCVIVVHYHFSPGFCPSRKWCIQHKRSCSQCNQIKKNLVQSAGNQKLLCQTNTVVYGLDSYARHNRQQPVHIMKKISLYLLSRDCGMTGYMLLLTEEAYLLGKAPGVSIVRQLLKDQDPQKGPLPTKGRPLR